ncbi:MAG: response regulator [Spirochaetes bacterium]|nr:response regulator [Spirochaetota bacterium]
MRDRTVLIVDDSQITVRKLAQLMEDLGYRVVGYALTGAAALERFRDLHPDLVTMDITLPDMSGIEVVRQILTEDPHALIIMITSHGQEQMVIDSIEAGAKGYVMKPVKPEILKETIEKVFSTYRSSV